MFFARTQASAGHSKTQKMQIPGKPVACDFELLCLNNGLLWGVVSRGCELLGFPGSFLSVSLEQALAQSCKEHSEEGPRGIEIAKGLIKAIQFEPERLTQELLLRSGMRVRGLDVEVQKGRVGPKDQHVGGQALPEFSVNVLHATVDNTNPA